MDELFGAPVTSIAAFLAVVFGLAIAYLLFIRIRNPILVRLAFRNATRRPGQSLLIIMGLMLGTGIIASAFTIGDSVSYIIKSVATESLRYVDELVAVDQESEVWTGRALPKGFSEESVAGLLSDLQVDPDVDGVLPVLSENVAVTNPATRQFESRAKLAGLDPQLAAGFDQLYDTSGAPVDLTRLGPEEVYVTRKASESLQATAGEYVLVVLGPGQFVPVTVAGVIEEYFTDVTLVMPLAAAQAFLGRLGQVSAVLISNEGDVNSGLGLTGTIVDRYEGRDDVGGQGLHVVTAKQQVVDRSNEVGGVFVSLFTTFGLFSIGASLLLIFLIFSMLATERKSEMGMARAVGMQRAHLVGLFTVEGSIYGIGSAIVGAIVGVGLGYMLVQFVDAIFGGTDLGGGFAYNFHFQLVSILTAFLAGGVLTMATVILASRRISRLNIVRAIRDLPEPESSGSRRALLVQGVVVTLLGVLTAMVALQDQQIVNLGIGVSLVIIGLAMTVRSRGSPARWTYTVTGVLLIVYWLIPHALFSVIREDWNEDFSGFFATGVFIVTGAVMATVNNSHLVLGLMTGTFGRIRRLSPVIKSAVSYPMRYGYRTGMSLAMFAIVIFSVTSMATLVEVMDNLYSDQDRLAGGYEVTGFAASDLNPVDDLSEAVDASAARDVVELVGGAPSVGTVRSASGAEALLACNVDGETEHTFVTGLDDDFIASNGFAIALATAEYTVDGEVDSAAVWRALRDNPGTTVVSALMVPARNQVSFKLVEEQFTLHEVEGLVLENEVMDPIQVVVQDEDSGEVLELTVIGVLDNYASSDGPLPNGFLTSTRSFIDVPEASQYFFNISGDTAEAAQAIEAAFFENGMETIDLYSLLAELQSTRNALFNLMVGFMLLGLVVGIVALGFISARSVVERRHEIGVLRAIGFSRGMVQLSLIVESSFIALLGIGLGVGLGLVASVNLINELREEEPLLEFVIPWTTFGVIVLGAYVFTLLTTLLPARQAAAVAPAEALRYE